MIGIYKITSPSGKIYIGQSINIEQRWNDYKRISRCKSQTKLYNSLKKYGWEQHKFEIIEECSEDQLLEKETYWKIFYKVLEIPSLCCRMDGRGGKLSEETKAKISKALLGKIKGDYHSLEFKKKISQIQKGNKNKLGIKHSEETKQKIGLKNKKPKPEGFGDKIRKITKGKPNLKNKGRKFTKEQKENLSKALLGKKQRKNKKDKLNLDKIKEQYQNLPISKLSIMFNISVPTMIEYLKEKKIFEFRKNYRK